MNKHGNGSTESVQRKLRENEGREERMKQMEKKNVKNKKK